MAELEKKVNGEVKAEVEKKTAQTTELELDKEVRVVEVKKVVGKKQQEYYQVVIEHPGRNISLPAYPEAGEKLLTLFKKENKPFKANFKYNCRMISHTFYSKEGKLQIRTDRYLWVRDFR